MVSHDDVRELLGLIKNASDAEYVFSKIQSLDWIPLLCEEGVFSSPYEPIQEGKGVIFPAWPQSRLLVRMAQKYRVRQDQEVILRTALHVPETRNVRVQEDLADVALGLDSDLSAQLVPKAIKWAESSYQLLLGLKLGSLISHLAKGEQTNSALRLARSVLAVMNDPRQEETENDKSPFRNLLEPRARFDFWVYEEVLEKNVPDLVEVAGNETLDMLCDLLDQAILLSDRRGDGIRPVDLSYIWRPAIEEHQQNVNLGLKHLLVAALRNAAEQIIRKEPDSIPHIVQSLDRRGELWQVFPRISLHVLRICPEAAPAIVRQRLIDRRLFDSFEVRHEYFLLMRDCFGPLSRRDQETILTWIREGPSNLQEMKKNWEEFDGRAWTQDDEERYIRQWKRDHLAPLKDHLDAAWKQTYEDLVSEEGQPEHPEFVSYREGGAVGPSSPKNHEELAKMTPKELVGFLLNWRPSGDWLRGASPEGLGRELTAIVAENPSFYAGGTMDLKRLPEPTYIRAIILGFQGALKAGLNFEWAPVLDLCSWAVGRERSIPGRKVKPLEMDPDWGWTRREVARLMSAGFTSRKNSIPHEHREAAWPIIEVLTDDPEPAVERDRHFVGAADEEQKTSGAKLRGLDPLASAINSVRGLAMQAVVQYAVWLREKLGKEADSAALLAQGFGAMHEVKDTLDRHLNIEVEPSPAIRAVYGERLPWLQMLDRKWAEANTERILPKTEPKDFWHAAWDTYICYCAPYDNVFDWLEGEYVHAIEQIGTHDHGWYTAEAPDYQLAHHLMTFYWRGRLNQELLASFFNKADEKLRRYSVEFVGRSLRQTKGPIAGEILDRLKDLWAMRLNAVKQQPTLAQELQEYGWWFASGKFDEEWSVNQLVEALQLARWIEPDHLVVEWLADLSETMPAQAIVALAMVVEGDAKGWGVSSWGERAKDIIRAARRSGNRASCQKAEDIVNLLGSRGYFDFGELLKERI